MIVAHHGGEGPMLMAAVALAGTLPAVVALGRAHVDALLRRTRRTGEGADPARPSEERGSDGTARR